jgi:hypothetical protein
LISTKIKSNLKIFAIFALMIVLSSLAACSSAVTESAPFTTNDQQSDVYVPVIEKDVSESEEIISGEFSEAYPDLEQETQNQEVEALHQNTAVPDPGSDEVSTVDGEDSQEEAQPVPQEKPTQVIKPTPRGNELVATNPSTVLLDSGELQLVELFAFW